jgi:hypothetical protein
MAYLVKNTCDSEITFRRTGGTVTLKPNESVTIDIRYPSNELVHLKRNFKADFKFISKYQAEIQGIAFDEVICGGCTATSCVKENCDCKFALSKEAVVEEVVAEVAVVEEAVVEEVVAEVAVAEETVVEEVVAEVAVVEETVVSKKKGNSKKNTPKNK